MALIALRDPGCQVDSRGRREGDWEVEVRISSLLGFARRLPVFAAFWVGLSETALSEDVGIGQALGIQPLGLAATCIWSGIFM